MTPKQGDIIQHHKHDPGNGKWHIYEVEAIAQPMPASGWGKYASWINTAIHTETMGQINVMNFEGQCYFALSTKDSLGYTPIYSATGSYGEPHAIYSSTADDERVWARPLSHFTEPMADGRMRFVKIREE